ncbi:hypothetical protein LX32DRAFT_653918 [Colletotrichum zoysiae]|uniref:Uncharacterized protein n=1 Tax=Colletotrichum zoysiae TaxID=1216348 RepID=A0AAD9HEK8_9PEZI|nr:hypothetical protein LX32DRAFT_653918 [Colletotrichum zoysiae]
MALCAVPILLLRYATSRASKRGIRASGSQGRRGGVRLGTEGRLADGLDRGKGAFARRLSRLSFKLLGTGYSHLGTDIQEPSAPAVVSLSPFIQGRDYHVTSAVDSPSGSPR